MSILEIQEEYDILLARKRRAQALFNNPSIEDSRKEAWLPELNKILIRLNLLRVEYKKITGEQMTETEASNGFH